MSSGNNSNTSAQRPAGMGSSAMREAFQMGRPADEDIVAEGPSMRSVAIMRGGPSLMQPPTLGLSKPPRLGLSKPPPMGISRPPKLSMRAGSAGRYQPFEVKQEWTGAGSWDVKGEELERVPEDFPLERTHRVIEGADGPEVAKRITESLRAHSIEAEFDGKAAKAKCKTSDFVSFRIRLYAGGDHGLPVVVEVQRRSGSAASFMRSCRAILNAAEGKSSEKGTSTSTRSLPPFMKKPIGDMKCLQSVVPKQPQAVDEMAADSTLDNVIEMIRSDKRDTNILGLENLASLTDPIKTSPLVALRVSKSVVVGDEKQDIREEVRLLTERDVFSEAEQEETPVNYAEQMRLLALEIFANALAMCSKNGCLVAAVDSEKWFQDCLIPTLLDELRRAEISASNAHQASCCVYSLMSCSTKAKQCVESNGGVEALQTAQAFGQVRHAMLADETARCLELLL